MCQNSNTISFFKNQYFIPNFKNYVLPNFNSLLGIYLKDNSISMKKLFSKFTNQNFLNRCIIKFRTLHFRKTVGTYTMYQVTQLTTTTLLDLETPDIQTLIYPNETYGHIHFKLDEQRLYRTFGQFKKGADTKGYQGKQRRKEEVK